MSDRSNGMNLEKRKRRNMYSSDEDQEGSYDAYFSEERYRAMLGEHVQKYKKKHKSNNVPASTSARNGVSGMKSGFGSKEHKLGNGRPGGAHMVEALSQNLGNYRATDFALEYGKDRSVYEPAYLDIGDGVTYKIPPTYEMLATSLNFPRTSDLRVEQFYLSGTLDLGSLASMMSADKRFGPRSGSGMGEPKPQYESLWARLSSQTSNNSPQKYSLKVSDAALDSYSAPEGAAGGFRRFIMSESGVLQVHYVKVLEKDDTYDVYIMCLDVDSNLLPSGTIRAKYD